RAGRSAGLGRTLPLLGRTGDPGLTIGSGAQAAGEGERRPGPQPVAHLPRREAPEGAQQGNEQERFGTVKCQTSHTAPAVSAITFSLRFSSATVTLLPTTDVPKPHWGLSARRSSGTNAPACLMRAASSSTVSWRGVLVVTNPSTTILSSGTYGNGSNAPERSSSYSSNNRWAWIPLKI